MIRRSVHICGCCGGLTKRAFTTHDVNQRRGDQLFIYERCERCATYQLANVPDDLGSYYPTSYYDQLDVGLNEHNAQLARGQLEIFSRFTPGGRLIDIGPGRGALLRHAAARGFTSRSAVEQDKSSCEVLRTDGVEVAETDDPIAGLAFLAPADAVTMFHVIEHVRNPIGLLDAAAARLLPGGVLVVATPNPHALSFRVCGRWWMHVDAPRHLYLIPLDVMRARTERNGLKLVAVTATDPVGLMCDWFAWTPWTKHVTRALGQRAAYHLRTVAQAVARPVERRTMRGSTYTAVFQRT
jgi:SAM-dependent methyltransferase